tara:strand:- start:593 stop:1063 length:471 start_codon:yes stop_codon:yes gene_type:complete
MRFALLAMVFMLSACQSNRHVDYVSEDAVTLVFSSDDLPAQPIICVPGVGIRETAIAVGLGGNKLFDDLSEAMKKSPEVHATVASGAPVIAGFRYTQRSRIAARKRCERMVSFDAIAGQTYQLRLEAFPMCTITATRQEGDDWVEQDILDSNPTCP